MARRRLGVVLLLPEPVATEVDALRRALSDPLLSVIPPHITLVPPVNVREADMAAALGLVRSAISDPIRTTIGPPTSFAPTSPTLHLAVDDPAGAVTALHETCVKGPLERLPDHDFVPHVTLLREIGDTDRSAVLRLLGGYHRSAELGELAVLEEAKVEGVRRWRPLAVYRLHRPATVGTGGLSRTFVASSRFDPQHQALVAGGDFEPPAPDAVDLVVSAHPGGAAAPPKGVAWGRGSTYATTPAGVFVAPQDRGVGLGAALASRWQYESSRASGPGN